MKTIFELNELYQQIRENPYLIKYLNESDAVQLINLTDDKINKLMKECPNYFSELSDYKENISLFVELKNYIDKMIEGKGKYKWQGLFDDLINAKYISTSVEVFNSVMDSKGLPGGADKIKWVTKKADALYFQENFIFTIPKFNACFISSDGIPFHKKQRSKTNRDKYLTDIIDRYKE
jgi:hypothetical protein